MEIGWAGAAHLTLVTRREGQGREVAQRVRDATGVPCEWQAWQSPVRVPDSTTLLMNATHLGCAPDLEPVPVQWDSVHADCVAVDVITNPRITPFLATARDRGCRVVDGVEMLVQLAMQIFQRWTGITPEEAVFQNAVADALGEEAASALTLCANALGFRREPRDSRMDRSRCLRHPARPGIGLPDRVIRPDGQACRASAGQSHASAMMRELYYVMITQPLIPIYFFIGRRFGKGDGIPVIFVHGYFQNRADFWWMARQFRKTSRGPLYGFNYPLVGFGGQQHTPTEPLRRPGMRRDRRCKGRSRGALAQWAGNPGVHPLPAGEGKVAHCITIGTPRTASSGVVPFSAGSATNCAAASSPPRGGIGRSFRRR